MYDVILLPIDGSSGSERATAYAFDLAAEYQATIHALHVVDTRRLSEPALSSIELVTDEAEDWAQDLLAQTREDGAAQGLDVTTHCCHGVPHEEIITVANDTDADAIVMGYQGTSPQASIGSVVKRVLRESERPVLAV